VCDWAGRSFRLIDTGGIVPDSADMLERLISDQAAFAMEEADIVLFVVDTQTGADTVDLSLARTLQRSGRPCLVVANKADSDDLALQVHEFLRFGLGDPIPVSATAGRGIGELLDALVARLPEPSTEVEDTDEIRVAVVGRPNVGKSSFINQVLGEERLIVSDRAGTTRDSVDSTVEIDGRRFVLIDTAGIRRRYKVRESLEFYTTLRTTRAIEEAEVGVVIIDATAGITAQDKRILSQVLTSRRGAVLVVNKWDLIEKETATADRFTKTINDELAHFAYLPIIYVSALTGQRVRKVLKLVADVHAEYHREIPTARLNEFLQQAVARRHPPARHGKFIHIKYVT
ncbi:MAG: ribosome biogenesis GTPase Der, partial [Candidatus Zixiibacteriota bacterium]